MHQKERIGVSNENNINISAIIPVYNVEKYIKQAATALFEQTLKENVEFLFINDCTKDRSIDILKEILEDYPKRKNQVRIISHTHNRGLAAARNTGIENAFGQYSIFPDPDDWCEKKYLEKMYSCAKNNDADIVVCDYYLNSCNRQKYVVQNIGKNTDEAIYSVLTGISSAFLWNKLIRHNLYKQHRIRFIEGINLQEDTFAYLPFLLGGAKIVHIPQALYHYRKISSSLSHVLLSPDLYCKIQQIVEDIIYKYGASEKYVKAILFRKVFIKNHLICKNRGKLQKESIKIYPKVDKYIWQHPHIVFRHKITYYLAVHKLLCLANLLLNIEHLLIKILKK